MRTVGVEEELLLVEADTGHPRSVAARVLRAQAARVRIPTPGDTDVHGSMEHEFKKEQLETYTAPHSLMSALEEELREWRGRASAAAHEAGARIVASGTCPTPVEPHLFKDRRYRRMTERLGLTASEQLTCGCHVHVSVSSDEEAIGVLDRIRVWLPCLLALSANSPFWQGRDTKYASFRSQALYRWPSSGPTELFGSADAYRQRVADMIATGVLLDEGMVYFDARPSYRYPTLEIRVADVCLDVRDAVLVAALCRGLVDTTAAQWSAGEPAPPVPTAMLRLATWQASREGIAGTLLDPLTSRPLPAGDLVNALVRNVDPALRANGDADLVGERIDAVLTRGNGAMRQRAVMEKAGNLDDVVADLVRVTVGEPG
jgi:glutamate---cysteine ligase / carboxylate-amine ligase